MTPARAGDKIPGRVARRAHRHHWASLWSSMWGGVIVRPQHTWRPWGLCQPRPGRGPSASADATPGLSPVIHPCAAKQPSSQRWPNTRRAICRSMACRGPPFVVALPWELARGSTGERWGSSSIPHYLSVLFLQSCWPFPFPKKQSNKFTLFFAVEF